MPPTDPMIANLTQDERREIRRRLYFSIIAEIDGSELVMPDEDDSDKVELGQRYAKRVAGRLL